MVDFFEDPHVVANRVALWWASWIIPALPFDTVWETPGKKTKMISSTVIDSWGMMQPRCLCTSLRCNNTDSSSRLTLCSCCKREHTVCRRVEGIRWSSNRAWLSQNLPAVSKATTRLFSHAFFLNWAPTTAPNRQHRRRLLTALALWRGTFLGRCRFRRPRVSQKQVSRSNTERSLIFREHLHIDVHKKFKIEHRLFFQSFWDDRRFSPAYLCQ